MASLSAHLRRADEHGRLRFHSQCPQCRTERLSGRLPVEPLVPRRTQAALTAGVLAFTSVAPATAFATDDQDFEGSAAPEQVVSEPESQFDPGGDSGVQWQDGGEAPDDGQDVPAEPETSATVPVTAEAAPEAPHVTPQATATPVPELTEPTAPAAEAPDAAPPAADATPEPAADESSQAAPETQKAKPRKKAAQRGPRRAKRIVVAPAPRAPQPAAAPVVVTAPTPAVATAPAPQTQRVVAVAASVARGQSAKPGDASHVVGRGESLWSIAADVLGDDASPARIAREVNRLWELNKTRIGTGDRNLLMAGTRLEL